MERIEINTIGLVEVNQVGNKIECVYLNLDKEVVTDHFIINNFDIDNEKSIEILEMKIIESDKFVGVC